MAVVVSICRERGSTFSNSMYITLPESVRLLLETNVNIHHGFGVISYFIAGIP
jgi:hypothetical protein